MIYQIGGGSSLLQPYLTKINEESGIQLPIRWQDSAEESIWMMAESYWKLTQMSYPDAPKMSDQKESNQGV